jgi:lysozyme
MMTYSQSGESITKQFESCQLTAYRDIKGVLTIGWGHTGLDVTEGLVWTQEQADAQLLSDIQWASDCVNHEVTVALTQPEFDALVDLCYNIGCGNFSGSTLVRVLNSGDYAEAAKQFDLWDHAGGQVVAGLLRRRQAETDEFQGV